MSIRCLCVERYGRKLPSCADQTRSIWECPIRQKAQRMKDEYDRTQEAARRRAHDEIDALVNTSYVLPERNT